MYNVDMQYFSKSMLNMQICEIKICNNHVVRNLDMDVFRRIVILQYVTAEWEPAFLRQAREFLFFSLLPREASK